MAIDTRFISATDLQSLFRDLATALPLSGGQVFFWQDTNRTVPKPVFQITGTPPNYSFLPLPNPLTLTGAGTFSDGFNNDILPYYFPEDADGNLQQYFIQVYNAQGVFQFSREAWPPSTGGSLPPVGTVTTNYIPNAQFKVHNNILATSTNVAGQVTQAITQLSPFWTFERNMGSSSVDFVTFTRLPALDDPSASPRYAFTCNTTAPSGGDTLKDLVVTFPDVNKFMSATQMYTFAFTAQVNNLSSGTAQLYLKKFFGTGGSPSPTTYTLLTSFSIGSSYAISQFSFVFGDNTSLSIGTNDDDYVALVIRLPNAIQSTSITDVILTTGQIDVTFFPQTPDYIFTNQALAPIIPDYNALNFYLPLMYTPTGVTYDTGIIGSIEIGTALTPPKGRLNCDGTTYETATISSDGIPYSRLFNYLFNLGAPNNLPLFGTGTNYVTMVEMQAPALNNVMRLVTNTPGAVTSPSDGAIRTNFSFFNNFMGNNTFSFKAYVQGVTTPLGASSIYIINGVGGTYSGNFGASGGTSAFNVSTVHFGGTLGGVIEIQVGNITVWPPAIPLTTYFLFANSTSSGGYYVWYTTNNIGADPGPITHAGAIYRNGIHITGFSTFSGEDCVYMTREAVSGFQSDMITFNAGSTVTAGSYWIFNCNGSPPNNAFYVWYTVNGVGTDPMVTNRRGIQVNILSTDTNTQVATKTQIAINSKFFQVPNWQGLVMRGTDPNGIIDLDVLNRFGTTNFNHGTSVGSLQTSDLRDHNHLQSFVTGYVDQNQFNYMGGTGNSNIGNPIATPNAILDSGNYESRSYNVYVNYYIRY